MMPQLFRAGWPDRRNRRLGWAWVWVGPYQVGWRIP